MKNIFIILALVFCSLQVRGQIFLSEIQDTIGKGYVPITDYDPALATYIQKYMLLQDYLEDSISWASVPVGLHDAVTLAGSYDYITLSGQVITRNQIDLTTDVTGLLPYASLSGAPTLLSQFTDDLGHVEESTTVTDLANGLDISLSTYDITVSPDFVELATETTIDNTDYVIIHDATTPNDGKITYANLLADIVSDASLDLEQVLTNGNDAGGLDALNFAEVEADEFIGDLRGAVLFKAQAGENLAKGEVVYVSGISGNTTIVSKADADDAAKMPAFGVVAASASLNNPVDIYTFGTLSNLNTSAYTLGDVLYVSTTAGQLTATPPTGESALLQNIAKVTRVHASSGSIKISGAGRTNATPNLNTGRLFVGNASNQAVADGTMYVDIANSRVGIGTNSPSNKLHVKADANEPAIRVEYDGTQGNAATIRFFNGYTENWVLGVDNTYASRDFVLAEISTVAGTDNENPKYIFNGNGDGSLSITDAVGGDINVLLNTNGDTYFNGGDVGIGLTNPLSILDIHDNDAIVNIRDNSDSSVRLRMRGNLATTIFDLRNEMTYTWFDRGTSLTTHYDDVDTYIWRNNAGTEQMRKDASGDLGIGTTNPLDKLHVNGSIRVENSSALLRRYLSGWVEPLHDVVYSGFSTAGDNYNDYVYLKAASSAGFTHGIIVIGDDAFAIGNTSVETGAISSLDQGYKLFGNSTGIGIFTNSPSAKLDVNGDVEIATVNTDNTTDDVLVHSSDGTVSKRTIDNLIEDAGYWDRNSGSGYTYLANSGDNVGIGTTSPAEDLEVEGGFEIGRDGISRVHMGFGDQINTYPSITNVGTADFFMGGAVSNDFIIGARGNSAGEGLKIGSFNGSSFTTQMIVETTSGNVGIGTSSPVSILEISKDDGATFSITNSTVGSGIFNAGDTMGTIDFRTDDTSTSELVRGRIQSILETGTSLNYPAYTGLAFSTANLNTLSEVMRLTYDGKVGIGLTNPSQKLEVAGNIFTTTTGDKALRAYFGSEYTEVRGYGVQSDRSVMYIRHTVANTGDLEFGFNGRNWDDIRAFVNTSFAIRNDATTLVHVNATNGNVGIGTSSPSAKLTVDENTNVGLEVFGGNVGRDIARFYRDIGVNTTVGINGNGSAAQMYFENPSSAYYSIGNDFNGDFQIANSQYLGTDVRFHIEATSGNVGIGTTSPLHKLHIDGNTYVETGKTVLANGRNNITSTSLSGGWLQINAENYNPYVGQYYSAQTYEGGLLFATTTTSGTSLPWAMYMGWSKDTAISSGVQGYRLDIGYGSNVHTNAASWYPRMTVRASGNVGINTSSPAKQLEIENTGAAATMLIQTTDDYNAYIEYQNNSGGGGLNYRTGVTTSEHWDISSSGQTMLRLDRATLQNTSFVDFNVTDGSTSMQLNEDGLYTSDGVLNFVNTTGAYTTTYTTGSTAAAFSGQTTISGFDYFLLNGGTLEAAKDQDYFELKYQDHDGTTHSSFTWDAEWRFYEDGYFHTDAGIVHLNDEDTFFKFTSNKIQTYAGNSSYPKATYTTSGTTFNENKIVSNDFRVNGTVDYMIFGDAGLNRVGIFEGSPSAELDVVGDTELNGDLEVNGEVTWSERALGEMYRLAEQSVTNGNTNKIDFATQVYQDGDITTDVTTNDRITVTNAGKYTIHLSALMSNDGTSSDSGRLLIYKNGSQIADSEFSNVQHVGLASVTKSISGILNLSASDYLEVYLQELSGTGDAEVARVRFTVKREIGY